MKFDPSRKWTPLAIYSFLVLAAVIVFNHLLNYLLALLGVLPVYMGYLSPITTGFVIAFLLNPVVRFFERVLPKVLKPLRLGRLGSKASLGAGEPRTKVTRPLAITLTMLIVLALLSGLLWVVLPQVITSLSAIVQQVPSYGEQVRVAFEDIVQHMREYNTSPEINQALTTLGREMQALLTQGLTSIGQGLASSLGAILLAVSGLAMNVVTFLMGLMISIYFLSGRERLLAQARKATYALLPGKAADNACQTARDVARIFNSFVLGAMLNSLCVGLVCFLGMSLIGWDYAVLISVMVGVTNIIPYFGPFIGGALGFLLLLTISPVKAFWFLVFILVLQQIDGNILAPRIMGGRIGLPGLWVIFAVTLFGSLWGLGGFLVGVPVCATLYALAKRGIESLLRRKNLSTKTQDYDSERNPL